MRLPTKSYFPSSSFIITPLTIYLLKPPPLETKAIHKVENTQRLEWLKYKGMDTFDAMQLYIEKVKELAQIYPGPESKENDNDNEQEARAEEESK